MSRNKKRQMKLRSKQLRFKSTKHGNVTGLHFKIEIMRKPLKCSTSNGQPQFTKKVDIKNVLTAFNHIHIQFRYEACEDMIKLMVASSADSVEQNLHLILEGVCKLFLDIEIEVRGKAIKLMHIILAKVSAIKVTPFFNKLAYYLSRAMTHSEKIIQADSLLVIDVYLDHIPDLIIRDDKLFGDFLNLISNLHRDSKLPRTLPVYLRSELASIKWKIQILNRIQRIFNVVIQKRNVNMKVVDCPVVQCDGVFHIGLYRKIRSGYEDNPRLDQNIEMNNLNILVLLLYETWTDTIPLDNVDYQENGVVFIDQDAASILSCVVGVLYALLNFVKSSSSLNENDMHKLLLSKGNNLLNRLLHQFPFHQQEFGTKIDNELSNLLTINTDPKCVQENLLICYVFATLYKILPDKNSCQKAHVIVEYINVCLSEPNCIPMASIRTITMVLRILFFENFSSWQENQLISGKLLDNIIKYNDNLYIDGSEQQFDVFNLLVDIALKADIPGSPGFIKWISSLPLLLLKPAISVSYVDAFSLLARQKHKIFLNAVLQYLELFLVNLPKLTIIKDSLPMGHIKLICLLYYLPKLDGKNIELIQSFIQKNQHWIFVHHMESFLSKIR